MKKYLLALPIFLFPYSLLFGLYCLYTGFLMESVFQNNGYLLILALFLCTLVSLAFTGALCARSLAKKTDAAEMSKLNIIFKLFYIPSFISIFFLFYIAFQPLISRFHTCPHQLHTNCFTTFIVLRTEIHTANLTLFSLNARTPSQNDTQYALGPLLLVPP